MMEFEPSPAQYTQAGKRRPHAPFDWHMGAGMDQTADMTNFAIQDYLPHCGQEVGLENGFANDDNGLEYGWVAPVRFANNGVDLAVSATDQTTDYLSDIKHTVQTTVTQLDFVDRGVVDAGLGQQQIPIQGGNTTFAIEQGLNSITQGNQMWDTQGPIITVEHGQNRISSINGDILDSLAFAPSGPNVMTYPQQEQCQPSGLGIMQVGFSENQQFSQVLQEDEVSQPLHTPLTSGPSMGNSTGVPVDATWRDSYNQPNHLNLTSSNPPFVRNILEAIEDILMPPAGTPAVDSSQYTQRGQSVGLAAPSDDGLHAHSPASIGYWESPRTPAQFDHSMSSSPNPQQYLTPERSMHEATPHIAINGFSTDLSLPQPTLNDLMGNFDTNTQPQSKKRKRKAFNAEDKKKVNQVRENGACISCHARKIPCAVGGVCAGCLKTAGDPTLAQAICLRTKLKDVYKSVKDIHDTLDDRQRRLIPLLDSLAGEPISVDLTVENSRLRYKFQLRLQVMKCTSSPSCRWKRLTKVNGIYVTRDVIQDQRYVILPKSLPSIDEYDNFGRQILATSNGSHSGSLTQQLDEFLIGYCKHSQPSRLRQFANFTLRVASLSRLVAYGFLNLYDGSYDLLDRHTGEPIMENRVSRRYVSETVHDQLRLLAAEGLEPVERVVFAEIDNLNKLFGKMRNGRIVSGICVLRLMLLYRDRVVRDSIRLKLPRSGERHQKRLAKAAFMYKRLTIAYSTLCRDTTPLIMSWEQENEKDPTVEDLLMINLFSTLQPAFEEFCNEKLSTEYDDLFKGLLMETSRIERRPSKKRKAQKDKGEVMECNEC